jgi:UDP-N-acetylmuramate dehydrogenase
MTPLSIPSRWQRDVPLTRLTTWRIGGPARFVSAPRDLDELRADLDLAARLGLPAFALGGGSNLLFPDEGYPGLLVRVPAGQPRFVSGSTPGRAALVVPAGTPLATLVQRLAGDGWSGLEWAAGIPGTVGGAVVNNAGAYGGTIADALAEVEVLTGGDQLETWDARRLGLDYRSSVLKGREPTDGFLWTARLDLKLDEPAETERRVAECLQRRALRVPPEPSCGSVFRNPPGEVAGRLIEEAGLAGRRVGGAQISPRHANFIVNAGGATARDVLALIDIARAAVLESRGIRLALEVQIVGVGAATR